MNKNSFLFIFFALLTIATQGQDAKIKGIVTDVVSNDSLAFATVLVRSNKDSSIFKGQITDAKGTFTFQNLLKGSYSVKVSNIGYADKNITIDLKEPSTIINIGAIQLSPSEALLNSVTVTGEKPKVVNQLEKQVFQAAQFQNAKGGNALEVLRNLPSIAVNAEGEITYRGAKGFLLLINGTPTYADPMTVLSQIGANNIENIELITAPSARYDADGKAGIINITTKKAIANSSSLLLDFQVGLPRVVAYMNATEPQRYGGNVTYVLKQNKWELALSGNFQKNDIAGRRIGDVNTTINNIQTFFPSEGERSFKKYNYAFRGLASYNINAQNNLSFGAYHGRRNQFRLADIFYNNSKVDLRTNEQVGQLDYFNSNLVRKTGDFTVLSTDYEWKVDESNTLLFSGLYENARFSGFTKNRNLDNTDFTDTLAYTRNTHESPLNAFRFKVDWAKKLPKGALRAGYQLRYQLQKGNYNYEDQNIETKDFILNTDFSADIAITNTIHAFYAEYNFTSKAIEFNLGLRYEDAYRSFDVLNDPENDELTLRNLFPSFNILEPLGSDWAIKAGLSRRVQRSTNNELNPFPEREHSETLEQGDPFILPEFVTLSEIGVTKDFEKGTAFFTFYRQDIANIVNRVNSVFNDTILNRIYTNAGKAVLMGAETGTSWKPVKWWRSYIGANAYQLSIKGDLFNNAVNIDTRGLVYSFNTTQTFSFKQDFSTQLSLNYLSERVTAQGEDSRFFLPNVTISKGFKENKIMASFQWQNIALGNMGTNQQRITTFGNDFFTTTNYVLETNILRFNLSYRLNQSLKTKNLPESEIGEREF